MVFNVELDAKSSTLVTFCFKYTYSLKKTTFSNHLCKLCKLAHYLCTIQTCMRRNRILRKKWPRISHEINDWLINQISTGISLPIICICMLAQVTSAVIYV